MAIEFVQRSPDAGPPDQFEQRPPVDMAPRQFVKRLEGVGGPAQSANVVPDDGAGDLEQLLSIYGIEPHRKIRAPRRNGS